MEDPETEKVFLREGARGFHRLEACATEFEFLVF
jgi:hypothetical protein